MRLISTNDSKESFVSDIDHKNYASSLNLFIRPNGLKHFIPLRYPHTIPKWCENTLLHLNKNDFLQWTFISISDYEASIGLKLIQWNKDIAQLVGQIAPVLQQIDLSNLGLNSLSSDLLNKFSTRLFSLNLSFNHIEMNIFKDFKSVYLWNRRQKRTEKMVKQENCWIQTLNELHLDHNKLEDQFPADVLNHMTELRRLYIQNNAITSLKGLNGLTQLRVLRADFNKITSLHDNFFSLKKIEYAYLSHNNITQPIPGSRLRYLNRLRVIDLSYNGLSFVPALIFTLPCLQSLKLDHNNICSLPSVRSNSRIAKESIQLIDLSYNQINAIPEGLIRMTKHLDLNKNKLRTFPANLLKMILNMTQLRKRKPSEIIQLDLTDNPITWPPPSIVEGGINSMIQYYFESRTEIQTYYGMKVMFLGGKSCGKTSLAMSLLDRHTRITESLEEITYSIESYVIRYDAIKLYSKIHTAHQVTDVGTESQAADSCPTTITIWDCSGHMAYIPIISFLTSLSTVFMIIVDITKFIQNISVDGDVNIRSPESYFYKSVGIWLDVVMYRLNYLKVIVLATKCDLIVSEKELSNGLKILHNQTSNYLKAKNLWLKDQITRIESSLQISQATTRYYEHLNDIYENSYSFVHPNVIPITLNYSKSSIIDFDSLCYTSFELAVKTPTHIPYCLAPLPAIWLDIEIYLDDLKHDYNSNSNFYNSNKLDCELNTCIVPKSYFCHLLQSKFNLNQLNLKQLLNYLNNTGKILIPEAYLSKEEENYMNSVMNTFIRPCPTSFVIINPDLFIESLKYLIHPNLSSIIHKNKNETYHQDPYVPETFEKDLIRRFYSATKQGAINRLSQCCTELNRGSGIVSAYLWIALVEYSNLYVSKNNVTTGKSYVEILWRWLEIAYPVPEPHLFENFDFDNKTLSSVPDESKLSAWKFKYVSTILGQW